MLISQIAAKQGKKINITIRVNPDSDAKTHEYISTGMHQNKFGVSEEEAVKLYKKAQEEPFLLPKGIYVHIGSQITTVEPYLETALFLKRLMLRLEEEKIIIGYLDLGGGVGINYNDNFRDSNNKNYFNILASFVNSSDVKTISAGETVDDLINRFEC